MATTHEPINGLWAVIGDEVFPLDGAPFPGDMGGQRMRIEEGWCVKSGGRYYGPARTKRGALETAMLLRMAETKKAQSWKM